MMMRQSAKGVGAVVKGESMVLTSLAKRESLKEGGGRMVSVVATVMVRGEGAAAPREVMISRSAG